jgi:hypothetical protein
MAEARAAVGDVRWEIRYSETGIGPGRGESDIENWNAKSRDRSRIVAQVDPKLASGGIPGYRSESRQLETGQRMVFGILEIHAFRRGRRSGR